MRRRDFLAGLGGAAAASSILWPRVPLAQPGEAMRRAGFLIGLDADDPEMKARLDAFRQGLQARGWSFGDDLQMDLRSAGRDPERYRRYAEELVALRPDVLVAGGSPALDALRQAARPNLPIVFVNATDPSSDGYLVRLARPGRNTTGIINFESRLSGRLLELLRQLAPHVTRVAVLRNTLFAGAGQISALQAAAARLAVELTVLGDHDAREIERGIATFVHGPNDGLIVTSQLERTERELIVTLAARYRLPTVYGFRRYVDDGGLISYGTDQVEPYRQAAGYIDRILKGERAIDLPVRAPTRYETVLNMKTAKAIGFDVPPGVVVRADEVIE